MERAHRIDLKLFVISSLLQKNCILAGLLPG